MRTTFRVTAIRIVLYGFANRPAFGLSRVATTTDLLVETAPASPLEDGGLFLAIQAGQTGPDHFGVPGRFGVESQTTFLLGGPS